MFSSPISSTRFWALFSTAGKLPSTSFRKVRNGAVRSSKLFRCSKRDFRQAIDRPKSLPPDLPVEEESIPGYNPEHFCRPNPGDILDRRSELTAKVGWGASSMLWLAQDVRWRWSSKPHVAIKISSPGSYDGAAARHELEIMNHIDEKFNNSEYRYIRAVEEFRNYWSSWIASMSRFRANVETHLVTTKKIGCQQSRPRLPAVL